MYYFQNYRNFDLECKHGKQETVFLVRKAIAIFEKRAPGSVELEKMVERFVDFSRFTKKK